MNSPVKVVSVGTMAVLLGWCTLDLYIPHSTDIRQFNPSEVARLDNAMWRSYYDKKPLKLYTQLAELLRSQYQFPFLKSYVVAFSASIRA